MNRRKLFTFGLLSLSIVSLAAVSTSLAWYVQGSSLNINRFEVSLSGDPSLELGVKDENGHVVYKSELTDSDFSLDDRVLEPVSTMFERDFSTYSDTVLPQFKGISESGDSDGSIVTTGYFQKELYLKSDTGIYVALDSETSFIANEEKNAQLASSFKEKYPNLSEEEIKDNLDKIADCLRFSLLVDDGETLNYYIIDPNKGDSTTYLGGRLDVDMDGYYDYDSNDNKEVVYGEAIEGTEEDDMYGPVNTSDVAYTGTTSAFNASSKEGVRPFKEEDIAKYIVEEPSYTVDDLAKETKLIALDAYEPIRMVLSVYIEGWDRDNTNITKSGEFYSLLKLKVTRENI
jgi:hypothetical protein